MEHNAKAVQAMDACAERLEQLNTDYPELATTASLEGVRQWRSWRSYNRPDCPDSAVEPAEKAADESRNLALSLLARNGLEDTLDILLAEHRIDLSMPQLIDLIGKEHYLKALRHDAQMMLENAISYEQIASLWNDLDRPALGGPRWNGRSVSMLIN